MYIDQDCRSRDAGFLWSDESEARIPQDLPVLIVSGALDPVCANTVAVNLLAQRYQAQEMRVVTVKFYEGARHELLNETTGTRCSNTSGLGCAWRNVLRKWVSRILLVILGLPASLILMAAGAFLLAHRTNGTLISSGERRSYLLYVPESYNPAVPTPLVISIHGFAEWPAHQMDISRWNDLADRYGFIVVYPSGTGFPLRWRAYQIPGYGTDLNADVVFISDLIDQLSGEYNLDSTRIYANGLSNGGGMSFLLSCELSERIAAFGGVSGAYLLPWEACHPARQVPAILFHGTADPIVPFQGGPSRSFDIPFPNIPGWVDMLASRNGCDDDPQALPASGDASGIQYTNCAADVVFFTIAGGGHSWPGGEPIPEFIVGSTTQDLDATRLMWEFFQQHPLGER